MNTPIILLATSVPVTAVLTVIFLLAAAAVGFITAWFFQKAFYTPIIKKLEEEKEQLNKEIDSLNSEKEELKNKIESLGKTISEKDREIEELKNQMHK